MRTILTVCLVLASGCGGSDAGRSQGIDGGVPVMDVDAGAAAIDTSPADATRGSDTVAIDTLSPWHAVERVLLTRSAEAGVADLGLAVWNRRDQRVFERAHGTFTSDTRVAIASASKLVAGLVVFDVIRQGHLTLDATTGQVLGWTGALAFHKGATGGVTVGTPALFDEQAREPFPGVAIGSTPMADHRYGLASWLLCDTPGQGCAALASPGAFGFTPWFDRDAGYYAILGMEIARDDSDTGAVQFAIAMMRELQPLIAAAIAAGG